MRRWPAAFVLAASVTVPVRAQSPQDTAVALPGFDHALRNRLAGEWGIETSRLVVEYGRRSDSLAGASLADIRYANRGGRLVITYDIPGSGRGTMTGRAGVIVRAPVATRLMVPGDTLDAGSFRWEDRTDWGPPGVTADAAASGFLVRSRIVAGQRLTPVLAVAPPAVRAGAGLRLLWVVAPITLELDGLALATGYIGETIPVRLRGDGDRVLATIIGSGTAQLRER